MEYKDLGDALKNLKESQAEKWKNTGNEFFKKGDYQNAINSYKSAIDVDPRYIDAWNNLGLAYIKIGNIDEANKCHEKMLELQKPQGVLIPFSSTSTPDVNIKTESRPIGMNAIDKRPFWLGLIGCTIGILVACVGFLLTLLLGMFTILGLGKGETATGILFLAVLVTFILSIVGLIAGIYGNNKKWGIVMVICGVAIFFTTYFVGILASICFVIGGVILIENFKD
jgi:tetratricopeptide (TPR) repeat protein